MGYLTYVRYIMTLIVLIGAIMLIGYLLLYLQRKKYHQKQIQIMDRAILGNHHHLILVQFKQRQYLIGTSQKTLHVVDRWDCSPVQQVGSND